MKRIELEINNCLECPHYNRILYEAGGKLWVTPVCSNIKAVPPGGKSPVLAADGKFPDWCPVESAIITKPKAKRLQ